MHTPRFFPGDLVRFKMLSDMNLTDNHKTMVWIDANGAEIIEGSVGYVLSISSVDGSSVDWNSFLGWSYNVYVPSIDRVTTGWGELALEPIV